MPAKKGIEQAPTYGLALSGGGFRASFFHIGVLASLAEKDLLRPLEAVSCVSGGSIIGAMYYLYLKRLLESKSDKEIERADYLRLIERMEADFLTAVEKNIRTRTFSNLWKNMRMFRRNYSRSDRVSELYDQYLYAPIAGKSDVAMPELKIQPKKASEAEYSGSFHPDRGNNTRRAKIPRLIINATSLNTGHSWQFTASHMGESLPSEERRGVVQDVDKNIRLRRLYYHESSVDKIQKTPLRVAVAASAAVPGLFPPLPITELYDTYTVQLVDGGVYDNQGIQSLIDEGCKSIIVSDASGQLEDQESPNPSFLSSLMRSNSILMDAVRDGGLVSLSQQKNRMTKVVHLKKDLASLEKTWIGGMDKSGQSMTSSGMTSYDVDRNIQYNLSRIRTDLDSFTEVEAFSLMASAYKMTSSEITSSDVKSVHKSLGLNPARVGDSEGDVEWRFLAVEDLLAVKRTSPKYLKHLAVASERAMKFLSVMPGWAKVMLGIFILALVLGIAFEIQDRWNDILSLPAEYTAIRVGELVVGIGLIGALLLFPPHPALRRQTNYLRELVVKLVVAVVGFVFSWVHLLITDPLFKAAGRIHKFIDKADHADGGKNREAEPTRNAKPKMNRSISKRTAS